MMVFFGKTESDRVYIGKISTVAGSRRRPRQDRGGGLASYKVVVETKDVVKLGDSTP